MYPTTTTPKPQTAESYFQLFADCQLTKGHTRYSLVDYGRSKMYLISIAVGELVEQLRDQPFEKVIQTYLPTEREAISGVMDFLLGNELGFFTQTPQKYPEVDLDFDYPAIISNAIIDFGPGGQELDLILPQLISLGCFDVQYRCFASFTASQVEEMVETASRQGIKSVDLILKHHKTVTKRFLRTLTDRYFFIKNILVHSAPKDEAYVIYPERVRNNMGNIVFLAQAITGSHHCGFISPKYFVYDSLTFRSEAKKHNTCLNRKIGIDAAGDIRNCPAMPVAYGNVKDTPLSDIAVRRDFQQAWHIHKDQIDTCKVCEFRYVCLDCRAFRQSDDLLSKPLKCGYNPWTGDWSSEKQKNLFVKKL